MARNTVRNASPFSPRRKVNPDLAFLPGQRVLFDLARISRHGRHRFSLEDRMRLRKLRDDLRSLWYPQASGAIKAWSRRAGINSADGVRVFVRLSREEKRSFFAEADVFIARVRRAMERLAHEQKASLPATREQLLAVFELSADAGGRDIKRAYRRLVKRHHPDRGGDPERFILIQRVYAALTQS